MSVIPELLADFTHPNQHVVKLTLVYSIVVK
jgi:hypothetical protein